MRDGEWSDWIDHDGTGCPLPVGTMCERKFDRLAILWREPGKPRARYHLGPVIADEIPCWHHAPGAVRIIRYRYLRPRALVELRRMVQDLPAPAPETEAA